MVLSVVEERWGALFARWADVPAPRAAVMLLHGYSEHSGRYLHVLEAFQAAGFAVVAPDHRGHGRTGPMLGLIPDADVMIADLMEVREELGRRVPDVPVFLVGASMGGLLSMRLLQLHPDRFVGAVLTAPAVRLPDSVGEGQKAVLRWIGRVWPSLPVRPFFNPPKASRDPVFQKWMKEDPLTYRGWIRAGTALRTMALMAAVDAAVEEVQHPILLTHGGDDERVHPPVSEALAARLAGPVERVVFPGLRHEAHQEPERDQVVSTWVRWLEGRLAL